MPLIYISLVTYVDLAEGTRLRKKLLEGLTAGRLEGTDERRHLQAVKPSSFQAFFILVCLRPVSLRAKTRIIQTTDHTITTIF